VDSKGSGLQSEISLHVTNKGSIVANSKRGAELVTSNCMHERKIFRFLPGT
jgi:hypothetical protein